MPQKVTKMKLVIPCPAYHKLHWSHNVMLTLLNLKASSLSSGFMSRYNLYWFFPLCICLYNHTSCTLLTWMAAEKSGVQGHKHTGRASHLSPFPFLATYEGWITKVYGRRTGPVPSTNKHISRIDVFLAFCDHWRWTLPAKQTAFWELPFQCLLGTC